jgi:hypothetical protein
MNASKIYKKQLIRIGNFKASIFPSIVGPVPIKKGKQQHNSQGGA